MLALYREALQLRRFHPALGDGTLTWLDVGPHGIAFSRSPGFACVVNTESRPLALPPSLAEATPLLASQPLEPGAPLPADTTVWLAID